MSPLLVLIACVSVLSSAGVTYEKRLDFFDAERDMPQFYKTASSATDDDAGGYVVESTRRTFDVVYDIRPRKEPILGADELILESESEDAERIELAVREFPKGKFLRFSERWAPEIRFKTALDPSRQYQVHSFRVTCAKVTKKTTRRIKFKSLVGVFNTGEADALAFEVETGNPFHAVRGEAGETARLVVRNSAGTPVKFRARLTLHGPFGKDRPFEASGTVAGGGDMVLKMPQDVPTKGVWRVSGEVSAGDGSVSRVDTRFARMDYHVRTPKIPRGRFRIGMNYHMASYPPADLRKTVDALVAIGVKLTRAGIGLAMRSVQAEGPDSWNWEKAEKRLRMLEEAGISVSANLFPIPGWAARPDAVRKAEETKQWRYEVLSLPPDGLYEKYCERVAAHFKGRFDYFEIGNEWDLNFLNPVSEAVEIQRQAYRGIKRGDPDVHVLPNGWAGANDLRATRNTPRANFMREFLTLCKGDCFDVHTTHCHGDYASYERRINSLVKLIGETGAAQKPWFSNESAISSWHGEREAAATLWKKIVFARAMGSVDYIWYNLRGTGWDPKDSEQGYGLITAGYLPRETFVACAALATLMGGCDTCREVWRNRKRRVYELRGKGGITLVAWDEECEGGPVEVPFATDAKGAERVDMFGNRGGVAVTNGVAALSVGSLPSALVLKGATSATASERDLSKPPVGHVGVVELPVDGFAGEPAFTLATQERVTDYFEAIPGKESRLWRGPEDLSAKVWLALESTNILVRVDVRDDVHVPPCGRADMGDSVQIYLSATVARFLPMGEPVSRDGGVARYERRVPLQDIGCREPANDIRFHFNVSVTDDDGSGPETELELEKGAFSDSAAGLPVRFRVGMSP